MEAAKQILVETLNGLSHDELKKFKSYLKRKSLQPIPWSKLEETDRVEALVDLILESHGQQSVEVTMEVLIDMNRTDLVERLSETSSALDDEHLSKLFEKEVTMTTSLKRTLNCLSDWDLEKFKCALQGRVGFRRIPSHRIEKAGRVGLMELVVEFYGEHSVEVTKEVLEMINRWDLEHMLPDISSGSKETHPSEHLQKEVTMTTSFERKLLGTLKYLSYSEFEEFKNALQHTKCFEIVPRHRFEKAGRVEIVELMIEIYGEHSVEVTREVLKMIHRTNLMHMLPDISSVKETHPSKHLHKEVTTVLDEKLLGTLEDLSHSELEAFKCYLHYTAMEKDLQRIPRHRMENADCRDIVNLMVETYREQSVEVTREVLKIIDRRDLEHMLTDISSGSKEKHPSKPSKKVTILLKEKLLGTLEDLNHSELEAFKWYLQHTTMWKDLPGIPIHSMEMAGRVQIVDLMVETYGEQSVEVTREVLKKIHRRNLEHMLPDISSGSKGPSISLVLEGGGSIMQASVDWTKLDPEVISSDADETPTYSLQSDSGNFECSVSGLRWVCKEKVRLKYQFCSWDIYVEEMKSMQYMPAGTLIDTTVIDGKLEEVYLPHWVCIDDNPTILDKFAVLHIGDCGNVVEKVSEVTPTHVKLPEAVFSPRAVLMKAGVPVKINCNVLIYQTNTSFLTLHVYLIPCDPGLQQTMDKRELSYGYKVIRKPHPEKSLKMHDRFILTTDLEGAEIYPEKRKLRYESRNPNFFEVFIENPDTNFKLKLTQKNEPQPSWICVIRKDEYQSTVQRKEKHPSKPSKKVTILLKEKLLGTLEDLNHSELEAFKWYLQHTTMWKDLPGIPIHSMEMAGRVQIVDLMVETYGEQSVEVTREVLKKIHRRNLEHMLTDISSGSKGPSISLVLEGGGSIMQASVDWTKLDPEVISSDADETPTYSLQSDSGNFECSVSGLRWVCKEKVRLKYQFCSWDIYVEEMKSMQYMPAGTLIDTTVIDGKLEEVYLPHWVCIDDNPTILDKFAVLHIGDCGNVVEKVSEVTPTHVKLPEAVFSPRAVLMKAGVPVKINCNVLIYQTNTSFLTLHVYLIPCDPGLQQTMDKRELSYGYKVIRKPHPEKSLKMHDRFILTADLEGAEIYPAERKLKYKSRNPDFFEVFIENPDTNFKLKLTQKNEPEPSWICVIRKDEYQSTVQRKVKHFVDKHRVKLIERVSSVTPILDELLDQDVLKQEKYDEIRALSTTQDKMREIHKCLNTEAVKDIFYRYLEKNEKYLMEELKAQQ